MDFKYINDRNKTPNNKKRNMFSSTVNCDSPFLSNFSTPPSRFTRILNPFEPHLINRLDLPTFSPSVFAKVSTPKTEEKFKWTIDEMSSLKPADIDEETVSHHVIDEDPHVESIVQQKIETFFSNEKVIVPSPLTEIVRIPLMTDTPENILRISCPVPQKDYIEGSAQTVLTLPPILPKHVEEILKPYFTYNTDQQTSEEPKMEDTSLYRHLFGSENEQSPYQEYVESSPASSAGFSPIHLPPCQKEMDRNESLPHNMDKFRDCTLSPILREVPKESRSACRLDFSSKSMSVDASLVVPDMGNQMSQSICFDETKSPQPVELLSDSTINWDMEYKHVSLASPSSSSDSNKMDISNSNTPHSRIFTSQRKRLSNSFKDLEDYECHKENINPNVNVRQNRKLFRNDTADAGYHTETHNFFDDESSLFNSYMFASTPSKRMGN